MSRSHFTPKSKEKGPFKCFSFLWVTCKGRIRVYGELKERLLHATCWASQDNPLKHSLTLPPLIGLG